MNHLKWEKNCLDKAGFYSKTPFRPNSLWLNGSLIKAIEAYFQASELAPTMHWHIKNQGSIVHLLSKAVNELCRRTTHLKKLVKRFITLHSVYHIKIFLSNLHTYSYIPSLITLNIASQLWFKCSTINIEYLRAFEFLLAYNSVVWKTAEKGD